MRQLATLVGSYVRAPAGRDAHRKHRERGPGAAERCQGVYPIERMVKFAVSGGVRFCAVRLLLKSTH